MYSVFFRSYFPHRPDFLLGMLLILDSNSDMLRTSEGEYVFLKNDLSLRFLSIETDEIADYTLHVRTYFWVTISYKYHGLA